MSRDSLAYSDAQDCQKGGSWSPAQEPQRLVVTHLTRRLEAASNLMPGGDIDHFQELAAIVAVTVNILAHIGSIMQSAEHRQKKLLISPVWMEDQALTGWQC